MESDAIIGWMELKLLSVTERYRLGGSALSRSCVEGLGNHTQERYSATPSNCCNVMLLYRLGFLVDIVPHTQDRIPGNQWQSDLKHDILHQHLIMMLIVGWNWEVPDLFAMPVGLKRKKQCWHRGPSMRLSVESNECPQTTQHRLYRTSDRELCTNSSLPPMKIAWLSAFRWRLLHCWFMISVSGSLWCRDEFWYTYKWSQWDRRWAPCTAYENVQYDTISASGQIFLGAQVEHSYQMLTLLTRIQENSSKRSRFCILLGIILCIGNSAMIQTRRPRTAMLGSLELRLVYSVSRNYRVELPTIEIVECWNSTGDHRNMNLPM